MVNHLPIMNCNADIEEFMKGTSRTASRCKEVAQKEE